MNIVTPIPTNVVFPTTNLNTEGARRDNLLRETIPASTGLERGEPERGLGSESDKLRQATGQFSSPLVYERPTVQTALSSQSQIGNDQERDNASDESAGREDAEQRQQEQAEQREVRDLQTRDREVRAHEQAHAAVGGQYAGSPRYEFETGPDGQRYAVGGEVSIDISAESTPQATLQKMQQVRAAALAPAEPSPQDLRVAAEASQKAFEARSEIIEESDTNNQDAPSQPSAAQIQTPSLDDIVDANRIDTPTRTLDRAVLNQQEGARDNAQEQNTTRTLSITEEVLAQRNTVIAQFYSSAVTPGAPGFTASV